MKKISLFLSIIMCAFVGIFFACDSDRYADLNISVNSVVAVASNNAVKYNAEESCYEVVYGESFTIDASVYCSSDISKSLIFDSVNTSAINVIGIPRNTDNGAVATFEAKAPSYDTYYTIKISSVETIRNSAVVNIKVILPINEIEISDNLGLAVGNELSLKSHTQFKTDIVSPYETNEKGVNYTVKSFKPTNEEEFSLYGEEGTFDSGIRTLSGNYYGKKQSDDTILKMFFVSQDGSLFLVDNSLQGKIKVQAKSIKYSEDIASLITKEDPLTEEEQNLYNQNERLIDDCEVTIVKDLSLSDISFVGGQVGFSISGEEVNSKLNSVLYLNSLATYTVDSTDYYYNYEQITLSVNTNSPINVLTEIGSLVINGEELQSNNNVLQITNSENMIFVPIVNQGVVTGYKTNIKFNTYGGSGKNYVDLIIEYSEFDNSLQYRFSDLYSRYLENLSEEQINNSGIDTDITKLVFDVSALPVNIAISQDGNAVDTLDTVSNPLKVFDVYSESSSTSLYGTKISMNLTLSNGIASEKINNENKVVRVGFSHADSGINVNDYLEIRDSKFNKINLNLVEGKYVYDFDLSNSANSYFYVKANKNNLSSDANFTIDFENMLTTVVKAYDGTVIVPNGGNTELKNIKNSIKIKTVKGVEEIIALLKVLNSDSEEVFYKLDSKNLTSELLYQKLVLKLNNAEETSEYQGTLLGILINKFADEDLQIKANNDNVKILKSSSINSSYYANGYNSDVLTYSKALSLIGLKLGESVLTISSKNGYSVDVKVEIVNEVQNPSSSFVLGVEQSYGKKVVTENTLADSTNKNPIISAKVRGIFTLTHDVFPDDTGILNIEYVVEKPDGSGKSNIISINSKTGVVNTNDIGSALVTVKLHYYKFKYIDEANNQYYIWESSVCEKSFTINVYEPATSIKLDKYVIDVYDYNSLGYDYRDEQSAVSLKVIINPTNATIANDSSRVNYSLAPECKNLIGTDGVYTAVLQDGQTKAVEYIYVSVNQFGETATLVCTVNIKKAVQVESIDVAVFDGGNQKNNNVFGYDEKGNDILYVSTTNGKSLDVRTAITPNPRSVYVDDLYVNIFKADTDNNSLTNQKFENNDSSLATLAYNNGEKSQSVLLNNGNDTFKINMTDKTAGYFYVVITSRDSMTSASQGEVYKVILVQINDGTLQNPFAVENVYDLIAIGENPSKHYVLADNINLSSVANWNPIKNFTGSLNGYNKNIRNNENSQSFFTISGLRISSIFSQNIGLFDTIDKTAEYYGAVMNLKLIADYINLANKDVSSFAGVTSFNIGGIAGVNNGIIINSSVEINQYFVSMNNNVSVGGMVGVNKGAIYNFPNESGNDSSVFNLLTIYGLYELYKDGRIYFDNISNKFVSSNPVNVNIHVSDSNEFVSYVGGIAGSNLGGFINGIYGIYDKAEEKNILNNNAGVNVNYITTYQSQGIDANVSINTNITDNGVGLVTNENSAIGGVVGLLNEGKIVNTSVEGNIGHLSNQETIGAKNNVGGVVGLALAENGAENSIYNISASVKIKAKENVGGIVGSSSNTNIELARVESYEYPDITNELEQPLIVAENNIGGIVGKFESGNINLAYSFSYIRDLNSNYISTGDIYALSNTAVVGGIVGLIPSATEETRIIIQRSYSTFSIVSKENSTKISGIVGNIDSESSTYLSLSNISFIGILKVGTLKQPIQNVYVNVTGSDNTNISGYNYYYLLGYTDSNDIENGTNYDTLILLASDEGNVENLSDKDSFNTNFTNAQRYTENAIYSFSYNTVNAGVLDTQVTTKLVKILVYENAIGLYSGNFIRTIPTSINVISNSSNVDEVTVNVDPGTGKTLNYVLTLNSEFKKYFSSYVESGKLHIIVKYSSYKNVFNLSDLFVVNSTPNTVGKINLIANSSNNSIISITDDGKICILGIGSSNIVLTVKENILATVEVVFDVINNFDEVLVSSIPSSFKESLLNSEEESYSLRKNVEVNLFTVLAEYVDNPQSTDIIYGTEGKLSLVKVQDLTGYSLNFKVYRKVMSSYEIAEADTYTIIETNNSIKFSVDGMYKLTLFVTFEINDSEYIILNNEWNCYFNIYSGATQVTFNTEELWLQSNETNSSLQFILTSDIGENGSLDYPEIELYLKDANNNVFNYSSELRDFDVTDDRNVLGIKYQETSVQNGVYYYNFVVYVKADYKDKIKNLIYYTLYCYDAGQVYRDNPATVNIVVAPQTLGGISAIHYPYTQEVSLLENSGNTSTDTPDEEKLNYSHTFSNEPKNSVLAGSEGLFVIDLYPYYSNITSVTINSSFDEESGNALQFVQLVKVKGTDGRYYYIFAPMTQTGENNEVYLNKYSYVPESVAQITCLEKDGNFIYSLSNNNLSYAFDDKVYEENANGVNNPGYISNGSEVGRLYVKTVAPTNIQEEESFEVTVTVKYMALNENYELVEMTSTYCHILTVESIPGLSLEITHEGNHRNVIAYANVEKNEADELDWLDINAVVDEGYSFESIDWEMTRKGEKLPKSSDYLTLTDLGDNSRRLMLGVEAQVGDVIKLVVTIALEYEGYIQRRMVTKTINVVDVVIESISIQDIDSENKLKITVSTSKQLKAKIIGYGNRIAIQKAENIISRSVTYDYNSVYYWKAKSENPDEYFVNLDSINLKNTLPFVVNKVAISNETSIVPVSSNSLGASVSVEQQKITSLSKLIVLEGSTKSGSVEMLIRASYVYHSGEEFREGDTSIKAGQILFVPDNIETSFMAEKYFTVVVTEDSNEDNPTPIYNEDELKAMAASTGGNYILMNDIEINNHTALKANFDSFDGNNKVIKINSFAYSTNLVSSNNTYSINMGLFDTVSDSTIIKNVIVALPTDKAVAMNLTQYSTINFGAIAAVNNGIITNCDVISVSTESLIDNKFPFNDLRNYSYTINIETSNSINGADVTANVGLFVGVNNSTGIITNSRVGRESVDILSVYDSEATVVYKSKYENTSPITVVKVYGRATIGGFVAVNEGTVSSSYVKNLQLESISKSATQFIKTGGFVSLNKGFVYGSFAAGWEEEDYVGNENSLVSINRKLGGGIFSNGFVGGFVYRNENYIQDCYSNLNLSGNLEFAARFTYQGKPSYLYNIIVNEERTDWASPALGGFVYTSTSSSYITTSYSLSKIMTDENNTPSNTNIHGAFEGRIDSPDKDFVGNGTIENCYFMREKSETFNYDHEQAKMLTDDPVLELENFTDVSGINEFVNKSSFNNFSFDNEIDDFSSYNGISTGGVWAVYKWRGTSGYPELISANTIAISCRVINVTKTNASETNTYYYTYVDGYDIGSYTNPYVVSTFEQYNNIFKDVIGSGDVQDNVTTKFNGNIRLINNIDFSNSEEVYSTSVEYTSIINNTSIFDGNYLAIYNIKLSDKSSGMNAFGLFKDIYYASVKNLTLVINSVTAGQTTAVGGLAGAIVNSNISNITLVSSSSTTGVVTGNNYVGGLAGIIVSNDAENQYTIANIKSNLSVVGGTSTSSTVNAITASSYIWERIKPISISSGLSELNSNLRLHRLPINVHYAGGIAGIIDLHQITQLQDSYELEVANAFNIHVGKTQVNSSVSASDISYTTPVSIISDFSGGLFGMIGSQTFLKSAEFIVAQENENHFIRANEVAGGIASINFGKIGQSYVSFNKEDIENLNKNIVDNFKLEGGVDIHTNSTLFSSGELEHIKPSYIGGIVGINVGNGKYGSGNIIDCYNRVDVKNNYAIGVGGIAGGSYIGEISNVYTTASLLGDLNYVVNGKLATKMGAIIGKIFENADEGYFADFHGDGSQSGNYDNLTLSNIVAINLWDPEDFDNLYSFTSLGGKIGALYGEFNNYSVNGENFVNVSSGLYLSNYAIKDYSDARLSLVKEDVDFDITQLDFGTYFQLWGVDDKEQGVNYDAYLYNKLFGGGHSTEALIYPNDLRALFSGTEYGVSTLRETYFSTSRWSRTIWNYDDDKLLPVLEYGYESSVVRIYTAYQLKNALKNGNSAGKLYVIMNDIDFKGVTIDPISTSFRGQLYGNNIYFDDYSRKPILFNLNISNKDEHGNHVPVQIANYSLIQSSIGATFANFNIVLDEYNIDFSSDIEQDTIASVLVGNAVNTTFTNVHVYSSIFDEVDIRVFESLNGYRVDKELVGNKITVAQGYKANNNSVYAVSSPFIKLATTSSTDERTLEQDSFRDEWIYKIDEILEPGNVGNFSLYSYRNTSLPSSIVEEELEKAKNDARNNLSIEIIDKFQTNASSIGVLVGTGSLTYFSGITINVNVEVNYQSYVPNKTVYIGVVIGKNVGEMHVITSTSNLTVLSNYNFSNAVHVGGIVGSFEGTARNIYIRNSKLVVGKSTKYISATTGNLGVNIGGMFGSLDRYTTVNEAIVGGVSYLSVSNCEQDIYVEGTARIGGIIGKNGYTLSDIEYIQSNNDKMINISLKNKESTSVIIGGIVAENNSTFITNVYNNVSIVVQNNGYKSLKVGGIVGFSSLATSLTNIVEDAEKIEVINNTNNMESLSVGGIIAEINGTLAKVSLFGVISTTNIILNQDKDMYVGGVVGYSQGGIYVANGLSLGDIILKRAKGTYNTDNVLTSHFINGEYYIGGLIGGYGDGTIEQDIESTGFIVLGTIRDYAIGQKAEYNGKAGLNIGPVSGQHKQGNIANNLKIYYNENISLVSDNGFFDYFTNVEQRNDSQSNYDSENSLYRIVKLIYDSLSLKIDESNTVYSKFFESYCDDIIHEVIIKDIKFKQGTKFNPIIFNGTNELEEGKYYIVVNDINITSSISSSSEGWLLNVQGYSIKGAFPVFNEITENSAVVGLLLHFETDTVVDGIHSLIANNNYGFVFACGVGGKGNISTSGTFTSLVYENYGVISTSFSNLNISAYSTAGLTLVNGKDTHIASIYNSYYTGTLHPITSNPNNISGICNDTEFGIISNCYTMGDIDSTDNPLAKVYAIAPNVVEGGKEYTKKVTVDGTVYYFDNLYKCFYDYVAYTGKYEGVSLQDSKDLNYINSTGIYVWSSSLSGDTKDTQHYDATLIRLFSGSWLTPGDSDQLVRLYKKSFEYIPGEVIEINTTWINYGYTTNNITNVITNIYLGEDSPDNAMKYLTMLYTGNGKTDKEHEGSGSTNGFEDGPYKIKHAGLLDILVKANNDPNRGITYRYYLLTKSIDFIKYTGETYWSKSWDENNIAFVGDLDGDGKTVFNMYSNYGLLRALPDTEISSETRVRDIVFEQCYSKTGLIAGYMGVGIIEKINAAYQATSNKHANIVYNGDFGIENRLDNGYTEFFGSLTGDNSVRFSDIKTDNFAKIVINGIKFKIKSSPIEKACDGANFAGGLVGIMEGGKINHDCSFSNLNVLISDREAATSTDEENINTVTSYAGGLVGAMYGGSIEGRDSSSWRVKGIIVSSVNKTNDISDYNQNYIGGIVGYLGKTDAGSGLIKNIESQVTVRGTYSLGGIAGYINGGEVKDSSAELSLYTVNTDISISTGFNIKINSEKIKVDEIYIGVIAGKFDLGKISDCFVDETIHIYNNSSSIEFKDAQDSILAVGGMVGLLLDDSQTSDKAVIQSSVLTSNSSITINENSNALSIVGGLIGRMCGGKIVAGEVINESSSVGTNNNDITGGIVGRMEYGIITGASNSNTLINKSGVDALDIAGGIVGKIEISGNGNKQCIINFVENLGKVQSENIAGGVVGYIKANLTSSAAAIDRSLVNIKSSISSSSTIGTDNTKIAGGIVGYSYGTKDSKCIEISSCKNSSSVETNVLASNTMTAGIIAISHYTKITNCSNSGSIRNAYASAGIIAFSQSTIVIGAKNTGAITGSFISGGIFALIEKGVTVEGEITNSGNVSTLSNGIAGGIVSIINSVEIKSNSKIRNTGTIGSANTAIAGGIIGYSGKINNNNLFTCTEIKNEGKITTATTSDTLCSDINDFDISDEEKLVVGESLGTINLARIAGGIIGYASTKLILINAQTSSSTNIIESKGFAGGIVGYSNTTLIISNVINNQKITGDVAGGIVAKCEDKTIICALNNSNAELSSVQDSILGNVINKAEIEGFSLAGGIVGVLDGSSELIGNEDVTLPDAKLVINEGNVTCTSDVTSEALIESGAGGIVGLIKTGTIKGVSIKNANVKAVKSYAGSLIGYFNGGTLVDYSVKTDNPTISGLYAGGIIGMYVDGLIESKKVEGTKTLHVWENIKFATSDNVGGLIGYMSSTLSFEGVVNFEVNNGQFFVGGLVGKLNKGKIIGGEVKQIVKGLSDDQTNGTTVGGLVGSMIGESIISGGIGGRVENGMNVGGIVGIITTAKAEISGGTAQSVKGSLNVGGLVGLMELGLISGGIDKTIGITAVVSSIHAGGMVGQMKGGEISGGAVKSSSAESKINGGITSGGLVGLLAGGKISRGVVLNDVQVGGITAGGLVGSMINGEISSSEAKTEKIKVIGSSSNGGLIGSMTGGKLTSGTVGEGTEISGSTTAGGLVGTLSDGEINGGIIEAGTVSSKTQSGGVVGLMNAGTISGGNVGSYANNGQTSASLYISASENNSSAGGVVGLMNGGTISGVKAKAGTSDEMTIDGGATKYQKTLTIEVFSPTNVGGVVGRMDRGSITGDVGNQVDVSAIVIYRGINRGGIVGVMNGTDENSTKITGGKAAVVSGAYFTDGVDTNAGGVAGIMKNGTIGDGVIGTFEDSNSKGFEVGPQADIDGNGSHDIVHGNAGGIVGVMESGKIKFENQELISMVRSDSASGGAVGFMKGGTVEIKNIQEGRFLDSDAPDLEAYGTRVYSSGTNVGATAPSGESYASAGGVVGYILATGSTEAKVIVENCGAAVMMGGSISTRSGGVVGSIKGEYASIDCVKCNSIVKGGRYTGGVVGYIDGSSVEVDNCTASVKGNEDSGEGYKSCAGGVAGKVQSGGKLIVVKCEANVELGIYTGGVVGYFAGGYVSADDVLATVKGTSNSGSSDINSSCAGGVVGQINGQGIENHLIVKTNSSKVYSGVYTGGVVGLVNEDSEDCISIEKCTNITVISDGTAGGIVGYSNIVLNLSSLNQLVIKDYVDESGSVLRYGILGFNVGGILGKGGAKLDTLTVRGNLQANNDCGGITGNIDGKEISLFGNLNLFSAKINGHGICGILAPVNSGTINGNDNTISVSGVGFGLVSENNDGKSISNITVNGSASPAKEGNGTKFGTIAHTNYGEILKCINNVAIANTSVQYLGGIAGENLGKIYDCKNSASISSKNQKAYIGGIAGISNGEIGTYDESTKEPNNICENSGQIRCAYGKPSTTHGQQAFIAGNLTTTPQSYVGGIVGYARNGTAVGINRGAISNVAYYSTSQRKLTDYRGQIAGSKDGAIVVNAGGHTDATKSTETIVTGIQKIPQDPVADGEPKYVSFIYFTWYHKDFWGSVTIQKYSKMMEIDQTSYNNFFSYDWLLNNYGTVKGYCNEQNPLSDITDYVYEYMRSDYSNNNMDIAADKSEDKLISSYTQDNVEPDVSFHGYNGVTIDNLFGSRQGFIVVVIYEVQKYKAQEDLVVDLTDELTHVQTEGLQDCGGAVDGSGSNDSAAQWSCLNKLYNNMCDCPDKPTRGAYSEGREGIVKNAWLEYEEFPAGDTLNGDRYNAFNGWPSGTAWCANFVSYCAYQAGLTQDLGGPIPKTASTKAMWSNFDEKYTIHEVLAGDYTPQPGDVIFYSDTGYEGGICHVGVVIECDGSKYTTIEGNTTGSNGNGNQVYIKRDRTLKWKIDSGWYCMGFGTY